MKTLRRYNFENSTYFITNVTFERQPILLNDTNIFLTSWRMNRPTSWVILPEHFHVIIEVGNKKISDIMHAFKIRYSRYYRDQYGPGRVWQNRFWDHIMRDQNDLNSHLNYIHFNPVKHGLVTDPFEYNHSSFAKYVDEGFYLRGWGAVEKFEFEGKFGE